MSTPAPPSRTGRPLAALWWLVTGALIGTGVVGLLTIGLPLLMLGGVLAVVGARSPHLARPSAGLLLVGVAAAPLYLAWLNREGPGKVCHVSATSSGCADTSSPWPFLAVATALAVTGVLLARRGSATPPSPLAG